MFLFFILNKFYLLQFDKEAKEILERQTQKDAKFAQIIASGSHSVSDSDTDEENESDISVLKDTHGLNGKGKFIFYFFLFYIANQVFT